jgi:hypothetical protein
VQLCSIEQPRIDANINYDVIPQSDGKLAPVANWSLTSLQQRLVKTGGLLMNHARYYWLLLAERPSDAAPVRRHAGEDRDAAVAGGIK